MNHHGHIDIIEDTQTNHLLLSGHEAKIACIMGGESCGDINELFGWRSNECKGCVVRRVLYTAAP